MLIRVNGGRKAAVPAKKIKRGEALSTRGRSAPPPPRANPPAHQNTGVGPSARRPVTFGNAGVRDWLRFRLLSDAGAVASSGVMIEVTLELLQAPASRIEMTPELEPALVSIMSQRQSW